MMEGWRWYGCSGSYLHQTGHYVARALARLIVDVGRHLDDLTWCVALHVGLGLQDHRARLHQHVGELLGHCRGTGTLNGERGTVRTP